MVCLSVQGERVPVLSLTDQLLRPVGSSGEDDVLAVVSIGLIGVVAVDGHGDSGRLVVDAPVDVGGFDHQIDEDRVELVRAGDYLRGVVEPVVIILVMVALVGEHPSDEHLSVGYGHSYLVRSLISLAAHDDRGLRIPGGQVGHAVRGRGVSVGFALREGFHGHLRIEEFHRSSAAAGPVIEAGAVGVLRHDGRSILRGQGVDVKVHGPVLAVEGYGHLFGGPDPSGAHSLGEALVLVHIEGGVSSLGKGDESIRLPLLIVVIQHFHLV